MARVRLWIKLGMKIMEEGSGCLMTTCGFGTHPVSLSKGDMAAHGAPDRQQHGEMEASSGIRVPSGDRHGNEFVIGPRLSGRDHP